MILLDDKNVNSVTRQLLCNSLILLFIYTDKSVSASNGPTLIQKDTDRLHICTPYNFTNYLMLL